MSSTALFRAVLLGLLLSNSMLLIELVPLQPCARCPPVSVELSVPGSVPLSPKGPELNVVDIRRDELQRVRLREVLGLGSTDRIFSVNSELVDDPEAAIAETIEQGGASFLDLGVSRRGRRVRTIVLLHGPNRPGGSAPPQKTRGPGG